MEWVVRATKDPNENVENQDFDNKNYKKKNNKWVQWYEGW